MHKLPVNGNLNHLPLRPIVSNINTSTHKLAKFLSKLLSPLCQSDHVRSSTANICPLLVTMNRKIKQPPVKLNFQWSQ